MLGPRPLGSRGQGSSAPHRASSMGTMSTYALESNSWSNLQQETTHSLLCGPEVKAAAALMCELNPSPGSPLWTTVPRIHASTVPRLGSFPREFILSQLAHCDSTIRFLTENSTRQVKNHPEASRTEIPATSSASVRTKALSRCSSKLNS